MTDNELQAPKVGMVSLGCPKALVDSERILSRLRADGYAFSPDYDGADTVIVNTCAVTGEAVRSARQAIRRAAKEHPGAPILVTGCAAQIDPDMFAKMPEVTRVIGNHEKMKAETWKPADLLGGHEKVRVNDIMELTETGAHLVEGFVEGFGGRARAFVQVQNGCDHRRTFRIIPDGRGPSRSVPSGAVVARVRRRVAAGDKDRCADLGHACRHRKPDTAVAPGNHSYFSGEIE